MDVEEDDVVLIAPEQTAHRPVQRSIVAARWPFELLRSVHAETYAWEGQTVVVKVRRVELLKGLAVSGNDLA